MRNYLLALLCCLSWHASAATFAVNDTTDRLDTNPGDGICRTSAGTCSLRAAIQEANGHLGPDIVRVPAGVFLLTRAPAGDNNVTSGDLDITGPLTIIGAGPEATIIDGGTPPPGSPPDQTALDRLIEIHPGAENVTISGLALRKGWDQKEGGALYNASLGVVRLVQVNVLDSVARVTGGGIYHDGFAGGNLVIDRSAIVGNAAGGEGGGIYMPSGFLSVTGTASSMTLIANNSGRNGGGIYNAGVLRQSGDRSRVEIAHTTVSGNTAAGDGGGIGNDLEGDLLLSDVVVSNNAAGDGAGAASGTKTSLSVVRGLFVDNTAEGGGGGVFTHAEGAVNIQSSEFSGNTAGDGGGLSVDGLGSVLVTGSIFSKNAAIEEGGGISIHSSGPVEITDSIVSDNTAQLNGGGVLNSGLAVTFARLTITGNTALADGGGVENQGSGEFVVLDTHISFNTAVLDGGGFHNAPDGPLRVSGTTIFGNIAENGAGFVHRGDAAAEMVNSTLSGNVAHFNGGGLYLDADAGLHVANTTITRNVAPHGSGVGTPDPVNSVPVFFHPLLVFRNSIVAGNVGGPDCHAAFASEGGNLDGGNVCNFNGPRDRVNVNPGLLDLADNGSPTLTHALMPSSPAVGGGVGPCIAVDQRGVAREADRPCDIGAYEFLGTPETPPTDFTHPQTTITLAPANGTTAREATFAFSASEPGATLECSLDQAPFTDCVPPLQYTGLSVSTHAFAVRATDPAGNIDPTPASYSWTIELPPGTTPPQTIINSAPPAITSSTEATFTFSGSAPGATFECSLDGADFEVCESPRAYVGLGASVHTFGVRATDASDNMDPTPASHTWTVNPPPDTTPPQTIISAHPDLLSENGDVIFEFSASEPGSTFACALDSTSFNLCVSPVAYVGLGAGTHIFQVRATDLAGNLDPTPASFTWTVLPQTMLITGPSSPTSIRGATFTFLASESGSTFECSLDGAPFMTCIAPVEYTGLRAGNHSFAVRAVDPAGNIDPAPVHYIWLIELPADPTPVQATILSGPDVNTDDTSATFTFSANESGATFECALDAGVFTPCPSPVTYTGLGLGSHTLTVHAVDANGLIGPAASEYSWTIVDSTPPETTILSGPPASSENTSAIFTFSANEPGSTFECALDGAAFTPCMSPTQYVGLVVGTHTFAVRATDGSGNVNPTPASFTWTVDPLPPPPGLFITSRGNGSFALHFEGVPGKTYHIQHTPTLASPAWTDLGSATADLSGRFLFIDTPPLGSSERYYRSLYP